MATQGQQRIQLGDEYLKNMVKRFGGISPVLEPNFDLSLCETELVGHLDSASPREVVIRVKFLFQLKRLVSGEKYYQHLVFCIFISSVCNASNFVFLYFPPNTWCKSVCPAVSVRWPR